MLSEELEFLYALRKHGIKLGLSKMSAFLRRLGNVQSELRIIHVAGTNGKGSCTSFLASILIERGFKVGIYTSPHFVRYNERIKVGNEEIPDSVVEAFLHTQKEYIAEQQLTFFEVTTALAFRFFYDSKVDYALIETGLGGRFDATNVCDPLISVITTIGLEHTEYLGETIPEIAFEKGGIIKANRPVCVGFVHEEAEAVFKRISVERKSTLFMLKNYYSKSNGILDLEKVRLSDLTSPLRGEYQKENAALACLAASRVFPDLSEAGFERGLKNVIRNTGFEGRFEVFHEKPSVIFDSAHNPDGIKRLAEELQKDRAQFYKTTVLFTALRDKNYREMIQYLLSAADELLFTTINFHRALTFSEIECLIKETSNFTCRSVESPGAYITLFLKNAREDERLIVTGSMYLLAEIKSQFKNKEKIFI